MEDLFKTMQESFEQFCYDAEQFIASLEKKV